MSHDPRPLCVVHIASGDRWAGAEVQVCTLLLRLRGDPGLRVAAILLNEGELATRLRAAGIEISVLDEGRHGMAALLGGVVRSLRAFGADLVHTHRQKENILGALAALWLGLPSLRTVHGAPEFEPRGLQRLVRALDRALARRVQRRIIAVSGALRQQLASLYPAARLLTIANGIDIEAARAAAVPAADLGPLPAGSLQVGIAGRLDAVKRIDLFLDMAALLLREQPQGWCFHVFGEGRLRADLEQQAHELGIADALRFHGHRIDIVACIAALDVLVMCSDHEGLPMTPLEAIAAGTPVVAHAVGGLDEILQEQSGGVLVHQHEAAAYARAVAQIAGQDCSALLERGRQRLAQCYDAAHNAATVAALYRELCPRSGA